MNNRLKSFIFILLLSLSVTSFGQETVVPTDPNYILSKCIPPGGGEFSGLQCTISSVGNCAS